VIAKGARSETGPTRVALQVAPRPQDNLPARQESRCQPSLRYRRAAQMGIISATTAVGGSDLSAEVPEVSARSVTDVEPRGSAARHAVADPSGAHVGDQRVAYGSDTCTSR